MTPIDESLCALPGVAARRVVYPAHAAQTLHAHDQPRINIVLSGSLEERAGAEGAAGVGFSVAVKPAGITHEDRYGPEETRVLTLIFDPDYVERCGARTLFASWRWLPDGPLAPLTVTLLETIVDGGRRTESTVLQLLHAAGALAERTNRAPAWLRRADTLASRTGRVAQIADACGVHRVTLARMYRRHFGCAASERRRWRRVQRAAHLIAARAELPLAQVAAASDFADQSHMCRDFNLVFGVSPTRYRALVAPVC